MDLSEQRVVVSIIICGCLISIAHRFYLAHLFENEHMFSHLSSLEREITLKSESAFYYSFYKKLLVVEDGGLVGNGSLVKDFLREDGDLVGDGWWVGRWVGRVGEMMVDGCVEHPNVINDLRRFNLYPELVSSFLYNSVVSSLHWANLPSKYCHHIDKGGSEGGVVESCEGIGDAISFYLECIFTWNGLMAGALFITGTYLSESFLGGIITITCFFFNHGDASRVSQTPPLRESFSFPLWLLHTLVTCVILRSATINKALLLLYASSIVAMLVSWQLSPFTLLIHITIIFTLFLFGFVTRNNTIKLTTTNLVCIGVSTILQLFNPYVVSSVYSCACVVICVFLFLLRKKRRAFWANLVILITFISTTMMMKKMIVAKLLGIQDDSHIYDIFWTKMTSLSSLLSSPLSSLLSPALPPSSSSSSPSFHTMLYICAPEFDFLDLATYRELTKTFLLPVSLFVWLCLCACLAVKVLGLKRWSVVSCFKSRHLASLAYITASATCYLVLASLIMRLKLFLVPLMCLLASIIAHPKFPILSSHPKHHLPILIIIISTMSYQGISNVWMQLSTRGMMEDGSMEGLVEWIGENASNDSVFAGSMSSMASVHLLGNHCITNHPHYEDQGIRDKTKLVYTVYSRKDEEEIWRNLRGMGADYVLLEKSWCFGASRVGCSLDEIWKSEEKRVCVGNNSGFSDNRGRFCERMFADEESNFFSLVYKGGGYILLKILPLKL